MNNLKNHTAFELLKLYGDIIYEFKSRGICKSQNPPLGDYTEWLVCKALKLNHVKNNSKAGYDATGFNKKYQIKGRRVSKSEEKKTQLSALRDLASKPFDVLIAVVYNDDFSIKFAYSYDYKFLKNKVYDNAHTNSKTFYAEEAHFNEIGVEDLTELIRDFHI